MADTVFIYALNCPITGRTRYVGKAKDPARRLSKHLNAKRENNHRAHWIRSLLALGKEPTLEILDEVPTSEWPQWEVAYIQFFRESGFELVNGNAGGEGGQLGRKHSEETRAKMGTARKGKAPWNKGKTCPEISDRQRGRKNSLEQCEKHSAFMSGNQYSKGWKHWLGRKHTETELAKMRAAQILHNAKKKGLI